MFPVIIQDTPLSRVWFKQDDEFLLPKANLSFEFVRLVLIFYLYELHYNNAFIGTFIYDMVLQKAGAWFTLLALLLISGSSAFRSDRSSIS